MKKKAVTKLESGFIFYQGEQGDFRLRVRLDGLTVWLTQAQMAELFQTTPQNIIQHLKSIYREGELAEEATCKEYLQVQAEGGRSVQRGLKHFSMEAILAVGYRIRSNRGTQFRQWATQILTEYTVKGFALDDERLKNPPDPGSSLGDPFGELLERIRDIRASEKRLYLRVREIFALAADYAPKDEHCIKFFAIIQNKLHFAVTGKTASELIAERANKGLPNMGLSNWQGGRVLKPDVTIAKNYLREGEIQELNRVVSMWLDFAEDKALRQKQVFLKDWEIKLGEFLRFNDRNVLPNAGLISKEQAEVKALAEYEIFAVSRREALEREGEAASIAVLEKIAKVLPEKKNRARKSRSKG